MADGTVGLAPDSTGKKVDTGEITVGANTVERQRIVIASDTTAAALASVLNAAPSAEYGLVTRNIPSGTQPVSGSVTANIGTSGSLALDATLTNRTAKARGTDGTNDETNLYDVNSGGGTEFVHGVSLRKTAATGSVELGTSTDPVRTDPTGSTNQPVVGTNSDNTANPTTKMPVISAKATAAEPAWTEGNQAPLSTTLAGRLRASIADWLGSVAPTVGQKTMANSLPVVIASDQTTLVEAGTAAHGAADSGNPLKIGGKSTGATTVPTAVTGGQRTDAWFDTFGAQMIRPAYRTTYMASFRLTTRPYALSNAFGGAAAKQFATIYHTAGSTKTVRIKRVKVWFKTNNTTSLVLLFELRRLSSATAPATGNPAITALAHNPASAAAEATVLALPTTAGSESNANAGWGSQELQIGVTGAGNLNNPPSTLDAQAITLWDSSASSEREDPIMRSGNAEGYAIIVDASAATTVTLTCEIQFTEE